MGVAKVLSTMVRMPVLPGHLDDARQVQDAQVGVGGRFGEDQAGVGPDGRGKCLGSSMGTRVVSIPQRPRKVRANSRVRW